MKILGEAGKEGINDYYLLRVSEHELAHILGEYYRNNSVSSIVKKAINSQQDIEISRIYRQHHELSAILNTAQYNKARAKLQEMLDALTPIESLINNLKDVKE